MRRDLLRLLSSLTSPSPWRSRDSLAPWLLVAGGAALGVAAGAGAYALWGPGGRRRRGLVSDQARHLAHEAADSTRTAARDLGFRARGVAADVRHTLRAEETVSDDTLLERARATLGHVCSHPHGIHIDVRDGVLDVYGPILVDEYRPVLHALRRVRGVREVNDHLEVNAGAGSVPSLQGTSRRQGTRASRWPPSTRMLAAGAGTALLVWGLVRRATRPAGARTGSLVASVAGGLLLARAAVNRDTRTLLGVGVSTDELPRRGVQVHKTLHVRAPVHDVFARFTQLESFPRFMTHVKEVRRVEDATGAQRFFWRVEGPLGLTASWEAVVTHVEPDRLMVWRSVEGSQVDNVGSMRFEPQDDGTTRMTLRLSYEPPAGALGHAVARLFGHDPKKLLDDDLLRFQSLLETGHTTGREGQVTAADVDRAGGGPVH